MSTLNICYLYDLTNACTEYTAENKVSGVCFSETWNDIMGTGDGSNASSVYRAAQRVHR